MRNIQLILEYDGSAFHGWQCQKNSRTVQESLSDAIMILTGERIMPEGAGRTDAGVHALGQVACFRTVSRIPADRFAQALNSVLPRTISVTKSNEVSLSFHPRKHAVQKHYRYTILHRPCRSALLESRAWHVPGPLDFFVLQASAEIFVGKHDFRAFCASGNSVKTYDRHLIRSQWSERGDGLLCYDVCGNGFLYNMVRIMVGTMIEAGRGKRTIDSIRDVLTAGDRRKAGITAPPGGLCMVSVDYKDHDVRKDETT